MTTRKIALVPWVRTWKKTVANDRVRIRHLTLKFLEPVGLRGMNKWWKNELLKEHWPKSWMCSSHVVMVCYWLLESSRRVSDEESQSVRLEKYVRRRGRKNVTRPFILPGEVIWAEWHESLSLDEIYKFQTPTAKTIPALYNNLKFFLAATKQKQKYIQKRKKRQ